MRVHSSPRNRKFSRPALHVSFFRNLRGARDDLVSDRGYYKRKFNGMNKNLLKCVENERERESERVEALIHGMRPNETSAVMRSVVTLALEAEEKSYFVTLF